MVGTSRRKQKHAIQRAGERLGIDLDADGLKKIFNRLEAGEGRLLKRKATAAWFEIDGFAVLASGRRVLTFAPLEWIDVLPRRTNPTFRQCDGYLKFEEFMKRRESRVSGLSGSEGSNE